MYCITAPLLQLLIQLLCFSCSVEPREWMASEHSLSDGTAKGNHGKTAILQLCHTHLLLTFFILGKHVRQAVVTSTLYRVPLEDLLGAAKLKDHDPKENLRI